MAKRDGKEIWVYGDLRNERFFGYGLNVLAKARELARSVSGKVAMVLMGAPDAARPEETSSGQTCILGAAPEEKSVAQGADFVYVLDNTALNVPRADIYAVALADAIKKREPMLVLFALTDFGRELAARTARICNAGLIADCADLRMEGDRAVAMCPSWGGQIMSEITFSDLTQTGFATVQPHAAQAVDVRGEPGRIARIPLDRVAAPQGIKLLSRSVEPEGQRKLEEAETVVVGGAGLGNMEGFGQVRELAAALGGELGATRPPVLNHWVDEARLIGQTGKSVHPQLLFSIGTSGAVQYTAGIMESKTIVAINRDPNAPIFQVADLGVVADAGTFLPLLTSRVKQTVMRRLADVLCEARGSGVKESFGIKVRKLREAHAWSVESLAQATGQTPEFIEQVEDDAVAPSVSFLLRLSSTLKVDPSTFLRREEKIMIRDQRTQAFTRRTENYSYQTLTPGAEQDHLRAFLVSIEARQTHKPVAYKHEGEEFIFVMEGELELTLGSKARTLKKGESIHFHSDIAHKLKSLSGETTRCLVVLYTI